MSAGNAGGPGGDGAGDAGGVCGAGGDGAADRGGVCDLAVPGALTIRRATADDVPALVTLLLDDHLGSRRESSDDLSPYRAAFAAIDADPNQLLVAAEWGGAVIGTMQLTFLRGLARKGATKTLVQAVRIAGRLRNRGFGEQLMRWAIDRSRAEGSTLVQLTTHQSRAGAHRFYERLGFEQSHRGYTLPL